MIDLDDEESLDMTSRSTIEQKLAPRKGKMDLKWNYSVLLLGCVLGALISAMIREYEAVVPTVTHCHLNGTIDVMSSHANVSKWHCAGLVNSGVWVNNRFLYDTFDDQCSGPRLLNPLEMELILSRYDTMYLVGSSVMRRMARHVANLRSGEMRVSKNRRGVFNELPHFNKIHEPLKLKSNVNYIWSPTLCSIEKDLRGQLTKAILAEEGNVALFLGAGLQDLTLIQTEECTTVLQDDPSFPDNLDYARSLFTKISLLIQDMLDQDTKANITVIWKTEPWPSFYDDVSVEGTVSVDKALEARFRAFHSLEMETFGRVEDRETNPRSNVSVLDHSYIMLPMTEYASTHLTGDHVFHLNNDGRWYVLNTMSMFLGYISS